MDAGRTEIINQALLFANQDTILDPEGESKNAKLCAQFYDVTLQEALSGHPWSFALVAAQLQQLAKTPKDIRFQYAYQLPANFGHMQQAAISLWSSQEDQEDAMSRVYDLQYFGDRANSIPIPEYAVQGKELLSNWTSIQVIYSRTDVKPYEMTPQFRSYLAALLASKLYIKLTGGADGFQNLQKQMLLLRQEARHTDSDQMDTMRVNRPNLFVRAREY